MSTTVLPLRDARSLRFEKLTVFKSEPRLNRTMQRDILKGEMGSVLRNAL